MTSQERYKFFMDEAKAKSSVKDPLELEISMDDVAAAVKDATLHKTSMQTMLNAIKKLA